MNCSVLWRRLDTPGHDAARLVRRDAGWLLSGTAVFVADARPARLDYTVALAGDWRTRSATVRGFIGCREVDLAIMRTALGWTVNGKVQQDVEGLDDLDFGFTPATNLPQLRRMALAPGAGATSTAAWLDTGASTLVGLPQHYRRIDATRYAYEAPTVLYDATLTTTATGFISLYPNLWSLEAEATDEASQDPPPTPAT